MGFYEQIFNKEKSDYEIAYFGILEEYIGKKFGGYLYWTPPIFNF